MTPARLRDRGHSGKWRLQHLFERPLGIRRFTDRRDRTRVGMHVRLQRNGAQRLGSGRDRRGGGQEAQLYPGGQALSLNPSGMPEAINDSGAVAGKTPRMRCRRTPMAPARRSI